MEQPKHCSLPKLKPCGSEYVYRSSEIGRIVVPVRIPLLPERSGSADTMAVASFSRTSGACDMAAARLWSGKGCSRRDKPAPATGTTPHRYLVPASKLG